MAKTKNLEKRLASELGITPRRGDTWVGLRPSTMQSKKHSVKTRRRESKRLCATYN